MVVAVGVAIVREARRASCAGSSRQHFAHRFDSRSSQHAFKGEAEATLQITPGGIDDAKD